MRKTGLVHSLGTTSANVYDVTEAHRLFTWRGAAGGGEMRATLGYRSGKRIWGWWWTGR